MPVPYPASMPTSGVTSLSWTNATASLISRSLFTFQGQSQNYDGAIRYAQITVERLNREDAEDWVGFLDSLQGTKGTFLFGDPMAKQPMGVGGGTPVVRGANQNGDTLALDGLPLNTSQWLKRGDWIQIGTGLNARLYKSMTSVGSNSSGQTTLILWPKLRYAPADNSPVGIYNPRGLFRRSSGTFDYTETNGCEYGLSFNIEEVI